MDLNTCKNCRFYISDEYEVEDIPYESDCGQCVRYPPKRIDGQTSGFPFVEDKWFCGEFMKKETDVKY